MTETVPKWDDLARRMGTGLALLGGGLALVWAGGIWLLLLAAVLVGAMTWELACMLSPAHRNAALGLAALAGAAVLSARLLPPGLALPLLFAPAIAALALRIHGKGTFAVFTTMTVLAGAGLVHFREDVGLVWIIWLVLVVIGTDVLGYFAGKAIGGPKFWPRVSPKKTWAGTAAGWAAAALVGAIFAVPTQAGVGLVGVSVAISMAAQFGDIAESAIKRRMGVKDSSSLLPGHGGLLDRFDGMLGATLFLLLVEQAIAFPPGAGP